jgi:hypothetical protein
MIQNYDEIIVLQNSLIFIDLDETIIHFPYIDQNWWEKTKKLYNILNDTTSEDRTYRDWESIIYDYKPKLLDKLQFNNFLERVHNTGSKLSILTARNKRLEYITRQHLHDCNINISDIHFSNQKGLTINYIKNATRHNGPIIFIDDNIKNINDVLHNNDDVIIYHMKHINL